MDNRPSLLYRFFTKYQSGIDSIFGKIRFKQITNEITQNKISVPFQISFDINKIVSNVSKFDLFSSITTYSNISVSPQLITEFHFLQFPVYTDSFFIFGTSSNGYDYATNNQDGKVCILDSGRTFFFNVANSEISFIRVLIELIEMENISDMLDGNVPFEKISEIRQRCIDLAGGPEYGKLYKYIVISAENNPDEPFELP